LLDQLRDRFRPEADVLVSITIACAQRGCQSYALVQNSADVSGAALPTTRRASSVWLEWSDQSVARSEPSGASLVTAPHVEYLRLQLES